MPKLILKKKAEVVAEFPLKGSRSSHTVGSEPGNDVVIEDRTVSMTHFQIERHGNQYYVRDMKSAYGTFINGARVDEMAEIRDNDTIQLGDHTMVFRNPLEADAHAEEGTKSEKEKISDFWVDVKEAVIDVVEQEKVAASEKSNEESSDAERLRRLQNEDDLQTESLEKELSDVFQEVEPAKNETENKDGAAATEKSPYYLLSIYGPYLGKKYQLNFGETRIGRDTKLNDIVIRENRRGEVDPSISRRHATVSYRDNSFYLSDKRSKSRTYVNKNMLMETDEIALAPGDEIEVVSDQQSTIFRFVAEGNWDFSFPKRAGAWWLRYRSLGLNLGTIALTAAGLVFGIMGWYQRAILTDVPNPLEITKKTFTKIDPSDPATASLSAPKSNGHAPPALVAADVNGDNYVDLIATLPSGTLLALDGRTKRRLWRTQAIILDQNYPPAVADINNDNHPDIITLTADARIIAIDGFFGAEIWTSHFYARESVGPPAVGDFDGNGEIDIAVMSANGKLEVGYSNFYKPEWAVVEIGVAVRAPLSSVDLDRDGDKEILIGTDHGLIFVYDGQERRLAANIDVNLSLNKLKGSFDEDNQIRHPIGAADFNGDSRLDLMISSRQGNLVCLDISSQTPEGQLKVRELWWASLSDSSMDSLGFDYPIALGDVDRDGLDDVIAVSENGDILAFRGLGREGQRQPELWRASAGSAPNQPTLFDFNKDGMVDVIFADETGRIKILSGKTGEMMWQEKQSSARAVSVPLIADLRKNTRMDIVILGSNGAVDVFKSNRRVPTGTVAWGQRFGSASNLARVINPADKTGTYNTIVLLSLALVLSANAGNFFVRRRRRAFGGK